MPEKKDPVIAVPEKPLPPAVLISGLRALLTDYRRSLNDATTEVSYAVTLITALSCQVVILVLFFSTFLSYSYQLLVILVTLITALSGQVLFLFFLLLLAILN